MNNFASSDTVFLWFISDNHKMIIALALMFRLTYPICTLKGKNLKTKVA